MNRSLSILRNGRRLVALALVLLLAHSSFAQPISRDSNQKTNPTILAAMGDVVAKPSAYTVRVSCLGKDVSLGTIVAPDGWIVTKASELKGPVDCKLKDGREFPAELVGVSSDYDLAMLKIDAAKLPVPEWRSSKEAAVGSWVATPGQGADPLEVGVISVETRTMPKEPPRPNPKSGYLGVMMDNADGGGVVIKEVQSNTAASKCGLKANDIVLMVEDKPVKDIPSMHAALGSHKAGDEVAIKIKREGKDMTLKATLGRRPPDRGDMQNNMGSTLSERRTNFPTILQHDTVLKPNECGGPLVDLDGKVVGVNIARAGRTESYAIPSEVVQSQLFDLMAGKNAPPANFLTSFASTPEERLKIAEAMKARALAAKTVIEKQVKEADDAIAKAKAEIDAEKKKKEMAEAEKKKAEEKKAEEKKKADEKKAQEKKPDDKKDEKKPDDKKPDDKKPEPKKADEKKPEDKKPEAKDDKKDKK
jgi:serine protease Do